MWKKILIWILVLVLIILIILFTIYFAKKNIGKNNTSNLEKKVSQEIKYLDDKLISMLNSFNNISYQNFTTKTKVKSKEKTSEKSSSSSSESGEQAGQDSEEGEEVQESKDTLSVPNSVLLNSEKKDINWNELKYEVENLYSVWDTTIADLNSLNVNKEILLKFSNNLNKLTKNIKEENKINSMSSVGQLYNLLVKQVEEYSKNKEEINFYNVKLHVINSYIFASNDKWKESLDEANNAINLFNTIMTSTQQKQNQTKTKAYIQLNELKKGIELKDKEIYFINYKNLMQELTNI